MLFINKKEFKYIVLSVAFALIWFVFLLPKLVEKFDSNNPLLQFFIFNLGLIVFLQIFLKSITLNRRIKVIGTVGLVLTFIALDIFTPPYAVLTSGELISTGPALMVSSSDYIAGLVATSIGLHGFMTYIFTYVITPFILLIIAAKLIPTFVRYI